ncbi:hypothetical protein F3Y22_tig00110020pilonHSYRG00512 [Hibiscus syriacus]|uniref:Disease resistance N-terminal domain-containing protein n=1 Tax=Hibiscus syriacus TaxID=106335 RepID=A0A6A3BN48_HIBSY|nr:hypothetical protein F3Y22_tig00110020pilonHSYRG00512 [Hibiscus syriacus]
MEVAIVSLVVRRISDLLSHEALFLKDAQKQVESLKAELKRMQSFLEDSNRQPEQDKRLRGIQGIVERFTCIFTKPVHQHKIGVQVKEIQTKLKSIRETLPAYEIPGDGAGSSSVSIEEEDVVSLEAQRNNGNPILEGPLKQNNVQMRSSVPLRPFTSYASVLKSSRFLKPAKQILDEFLGLDYGVSDIPLEILAEDGADNDPITCSYKIQHRWKNSRLILLLDEVYA